MKLNEENIPHSEVKDKKRFIRFRSLGDGYTEENIVAAILGKDKKPELIKPQKLNLLIDIQEKDYQ